MKKLSLFFVALSLFILSCSVNDISGPDKKAETADLEFSITLAKAQVKIMSMSGYLSKSSEDTIWFDFIIKDDEAHCKVADITAGDWELTVNAFNTDNILAYSGSTTVTITPGEETTIYLHLDPATGSLNVIVTWGDDKGIIVFQANYDGNYNIYSMNTDGSNIKQLTSNSYNDIYPRISPDKEKIIFCSNHDGKAFPYIMNIDGSNQEQLNISNRSIGTCDWSIDGKSIVYYEGYDGITDICTYNFETDSTSTIFHNSAVNWVPNWSPVEDVIAFYSNDSGTFFTYLINADGTGLTSLTDHTIMNQERVPQFSPDGQRVAIAGKTTYIQWGIFIVDKDGSNFQEIINTPRVDEGYPQWSPDGKTILFHRNDGGEKQHGIYMIDIKTKKMKTILDTNFDERNAHWR